MLIVILKSQDGLRLRLVALFVSDVQVCLPYFCFNFIFIGVHRQLGVHITKIKSVNLDKDFSFAGEAFPMDNFDVRERLDRELSRNTYWHSNTLLNIKKGNKYFPLMKKILK